MPLAILTFLVGVAYIPGLPSNATVGRWIVFGVGVAVLLWTIEFGRISPRSFPTVTPAHHMGAWLLAWIVLGFAWCLSAWDHAFGLIQFVLMAAIFCIAAEQRSLDRCWQGLGLAVTVSAGFTIAQALGFDRLWSITPFTDPGLFLSRNVAGEVAVLALIGAIGTRTWWLVPGPIVQTLLAGGRTPLLALLAAALVWVWTSAPRDRRSAYGALAAAGAGVVVLLGALAFPRLLYVSDRIVLWREALIGMNPLGDGLGSFSIVFTDAEFAHNEFIHYGFEIGIGSLLIWGIVAYAFGAGKVLERAGLAALLAQCAVYFPLHAPVTAFMAALLAGYLSGVRRRARAAQSRSGASGARGLQHAEPIGVGALSEADAGRVDLSLRPESALVS